MKNKYTENNISELIRSTMQAVGMDVELKQDNSGVNMSYNFIGDYVGFDVNRLIEARSEMQSPVSLELYIKVITMHELGHAVDRHALLDSLTRTIEIFNMKRNYSLFEQYNNVDLLSMIMEEHKMNIIFEETAWKNAKKLNLEHQIVDMEFFNIVEAHSLSTYKNLYLEDLQLYEELVAVQSAQIA